jgi:hypothetical protein
LSIVDIKNKVDITKFIFRDKEFLTLLEIQAFHDIINFKDEDRAKIEAIIKRDMAFL